MPAGVRLFKKLKLKLKKEKKLKKKMSAATFVVEVAAASAAADTVSPFFHFAESLCCGALSALYLVVCCTGVLEVRLAM